MAGEGKKKGKKASKDVSELPEHLKVRHDYVIAGPELNYHVSTPTSASMYMSLGIDNSWSFQDFKDGFDIVINSLDKEMMEFELIGCDPAIANALRRILISEVPTVAIEHVFMVDNTSIMPDELLAHRLGLLPLSVDPKLLDTRSGDARATERNTVVMKLHVMCPRKHSSQPSATLKVLSKDLVWLPGGSEMPDETGCAFARDQRGVLGEDAAPACVLDDILVMKLRPGQTIQLEAHCVKGCGGEHAKWSPVATAWYRLYPEVAILKDISGDRAQTLLREFPGLFYLDQDNKLAARNARDHLMLLEKLRRFAGEEEWEGWIQLRRRKTHFLFTIETTGVLDPPELLRQAIDILAEKCRRLRSQLS